MVRKSSPLTPVRGRVARVTRTDNCGRVVIGEYNQAVSEGVVTAGFTALTSETEEISVTNFAGKRCVWEPSITELAGYSVNLTFCSVDFEFFEIITKQTLVLNAQGDVVGLEMDTKTPVNEDGFALEIFVGGQGGDTCDDPNAEGEYGYLLLPLLKGGIVGDFEVSNGAVNFQVSGASTRDGNNWGYGPYPVERGAGTNEVQRLTVTGAPTGGTFTLTYNGQTTAAIAYNATASTVQAALEALSNVDPGEIQVTGGPLPASFLTFTFVDDLGEQDVPAMTFTGSFTGGTSPAGAVTVITPGAPGAVGALYQPVSKTAALRMMLTTVAPPLPFNGARPVLNSALPNFTNITVAAGSGALDKSFTLTPVATGPVHWDFGDETWDYVAAPGATTHTFETAGTYKVRATQNGLRWFEVTVTVP